VSHEAERLKTRRRARSTRCSIALGALAFALAAGAGAAAAETLNDALVHAYQNNPRILAARDRLKATDEQIAQAISLFRPSVTVQATGGFATTRQWLDSSPRSGQRLNPASASLTITQPLFRGGREYSELERAEKTIRAERARLHGTEQDVFIEVVRAYMNVVRDQAIVGLRTSNVAVLQRQLQAVRDRFNVGEVTRTDVAQAEASVQRAEANRVVAIGNLENSRANYVNLVGRMPGRLAEPRLTVALPAQLKLALDTARGNNPTIIAAHFEENAARHAVDSVIRELMPQVTLNGSVNRNYEQNFRNQKSDSASLVASVTVPLYESGATHSRVRAAKQTVFQRGNELAQARRTVEEAATRAWSSLQAARSSVRAFEAESRANNIALEGVRQENRAGLRTVLDVLDAEQRLLDSQVNLVGARRDLAVAAYELVSAMGRLTAAELKLPVPIYDANAYYRAIKYLPAGFGPPTGKPSMLPGEKAP
jgi:TolC family type I secretion outer membrane protein